MCRLLAFNTKNEINNNVIEALVKSAKKDPFSTYSSHPDGWGFVIYAKKGNFWRSIYYRSPEPIYEDPDGLELLRSIKAERIVGIAHVRKGNKRFLLGVSHNHPYHKRINQYDVYFAHNGSINRKGFIHVNPSLPYTDSYLFLEELSHVVKDSIEEAYRQLFERLKEYSTSLNSSLLLYSEGEGPQVLIGYYYSKINKRELNEEYYKIYRLEDYVFSSTIKYYLNKYDDELEYNAITKL